MLSTKTLSLILSALLLSAGQADARMRWLERDGRVVLAPRRTGQEHPEAINLISAACNTGVCATLAGEAISTLLAAAQECTQQDAADNMITVAKTFTDVTEKAALIAGAVAFRQAEKNVQPRFNTNPVGLQNSVYCQKAPVNAELNGLFQAQDPANDPNLFFDPLDKAQINLGDRPNTFPFGTSGAVATNASATVTSAAAVETAAATTVAAVETASAVETGAAVTTDVAATAVATATESVAAIETAAATAAATATAASICPAQITVTVTADAAAVTTAAATTVVASAVTTAAAAAATTAAVAAAADGSVDSTSTTKFGTCTNAGVHFAAGINNRKATEFTFEPANLSDFNHGEALNPQIIFEFICDTLTNKCGGSSADVSACKTFATTITTRDAAAASKWNAGIEALAF